MNHIRDTFAPAHTYICELYEDKQGQRFVKCILFLRYSVAVLLFSFHRCSALREPEMNQLSSLIQPHADPCKSPLNDAMNTISLAVAVVMVLFLSMFLCAGFVNKVKYKISKVDCSYIIPLHQKHYILYAQKDFLEKELILTHGLQKSQCANVTVVTVTIF